MTIHHTAQIPFLSVKYTTSFSDAFHIPTRLSYSCVTKSSPFNLLFFALCVFVEKVRNGSIDYVVYLFPITDLIRYFIIHELWIKCLAQRFVRDFPFAFGCSIATLFSIDAEKEDKINIFAMLEYMPSISYFNYAFVINELLAEMQKKFNWKCAFKSACDWLCKFRQLCCINILVSSSISFEICRFCHLRVDDDLCSMGINW